MARVGHLNYDRIDHRHIQAHGHPVVQKAGVQHLSLFVDEVFLVQRPADALGNRPLNLAFHIAGMDRFARVLEAGVPEDRDFAGFRVYLQVHDVDSYGGPRPSWIYTGPSHNGATGGILPGRQLLESKPQLRVRLVLQDAVLVFNVIHRDFPYLGGTLNHLLLYVQGRLITGPARLECHAASCGVGGKAD